MSVFSKLKDFLSRHRNKFVIGGLLITSSVLLTRYAQHRLREWHEKEALEFIEKNRKRSHFESINRTCNQTILNLSSSLLDHIYDVINTDDTIERLKKNPENRIELWNMLKNQVFTKAACVIYSLVILVITLKLQLNIVGGYLYKDPQCVPANLQEKYLSLCKSFLNNGVDKLASTLEIEICNILQHVDLKKEMRLSDIETIFWSLQGKLDSNKSNPVSQLKQYIFDKEPPTHNDVYSSMLRDTADLLESEEVKALVVHNVNAGFVLLGDQISEFLNQPKIEAKSNNEFQSPFAYKKPLAKIIPILNGLLSKQSLPHNLIHHLVTSEKLQTLSANIYESLLG